MTEIIFASQNQGKIEEIQTLLKGHVKLLGLRDLHFTNELLETGNTLEENAAQKAIFVSKRFGFDCFADDSGLEVDALEGRPGVLSARYGGTEKSDTKNCEKLLSDLNGISNRKACFRTVIALSLDRKLYYFEGKIDGSITTTGRGNNGFGYDPIFIPEGFDLTFAEMDKNQKNEISHRAIAIKKLVEFLTSLN